MMAAGFAGKTDIRGKKVERTDPVMNRAGGGLGLGNDPQLCNMTCAGLVYGRYVKLSNQIRWTVCEVEVYTTVADWTVAPTPVPPTPPPTPSPTPASEIHTDWVWTRLPSPENVS